MDVIEYAERGYMIPSLGVLSGGHDGYEGHGRLILPMYHHVALIPPCCDKDSTNSPNTSARWETV